MIESLFPGFTEALLAQGVLQCDIGADAGFDIGGQRLAPCRLGRMGLAASRPTIEAEVRRRVRALPNVRLMDGVEVQFPLHDAMGRRVAGVCFRRVGGTDRLEDLAAVLTVDCSGRGSHTAGWLQAWGYGAPAEERVPIGLSYTSAYFRRDPSVPPPLLCIIGAATPEMPRPSILLAQEPDAEGQPRWVASVGGYAGDHPTPTLDGLRERARDMDCAEIAELATRGEVLGPVMRYSFPYSRRYRYERLAHFPAGYLVMGDALASFNPIYGQGMTVASCQAMVLRSLLARRPDQLASRYFRAAAKVVDIPWRLAVGGDLALPVVPGPRPLSVRLVNAYVRQVQRAAVHDPAVAAAFLKVLHLLAGPPSLFAPRVLWRVLRHGTRRRREGA